MRNLDLSALRSLVAILDYGGVSHAANQLNMTQSAVSMQIKRMEELLDRRLFRREARKMIPTDEGELLIGYARKMLELHDEAWGRLKAAEYECELRLGVPVDIVEPYIPAILNQYRRLYPRVRLVFETSVTAHLLRDFEKGKFDVILTTEESGKGDEVVRKPLTWMQAKGGEAAKRRPLPIALEPNCSFRNLVISALNAAGIPWQNSQGVNSWQAIQAMVTADLAVHAEIKDISISSFGREEYTGHELPKLPEIGIYVYHRDDQDSLALQALIELISRTYSRSADSLRIAS